MPLIICERQLHQMQIYPIVSWIKFHQTRFLQFLFQHALSPGQSPQPCSGPDKAEAVQPSDARPECISWSWHRTEPRTSSPKGERVAVLVMPVYRGCLWKCANTGVLALPQPACVCPCSIRIATPPHLDSQTTPESVPECGQLQLDSVSLHVLTTELRVGGGEVGFKFFYS